jgi:hypothetical protein
MKPERRRDGLVVKELPEEVLVYDLERHRAHCLNPAAAAVFKSCDGERTVGEIARILRRETGAPADEAWVHLALDRLEKAHLLEERSAPSAGRGVSRRDVLKKAGVGLAAALPLVTSIVAPTPVEAAATCVQCCSGKPDGTPCGNPVMLCTGVCTCQSGLCVGGCGPDC